MLLAQDIMTRKVVTVRSDSTISEAAAQMVRHRISAVPVVDDGLLVGIISEGDLVHRAEIGTAERSRSWWLTLFRDPSDYGQGIRPVPLQARRRPDDPDRPIGGGEGVG